MVGTIPFGVIKSPMSPCRVMLLQEYCPPLAKARVRTKITRVERLAEGGMGASSPYMHWKEEKIWLCNGIQAASHLSEYVMSSKGKNHDERSKVNDLHDTLMAVGTLEESIDDGHAIIGIASGPEFYVSITPIMKLEKIPMEGYVDISGLEQHIQEIKVDVMDTALDCSLNVA
ncbi:hypothetical protein HD554DRAFT_2040078 [Boletus coccyginus]|nr:hypothetical protein HD554DRAFT_2040078 [Boletus coccyginus]